MKELKFNKMTGTYLTKKQIESEYCDCEKPTLGINTWTCGCGKGFKKVKK